MRKEDRFLGLMRGEILDGTRPPGTVLPTQRELAAEYGHDVREVRAAMQRLEAAGLVRIRRKAGTVVLDPQPVRRMGVERYSRSRWMHDGLAPLEADRAAANGGERTTVDQRNQVDTLPAPAEVADGLGIAEGDATVRRYRKLYDSSGMPTHVIASWYRINDVIGTPIMETNPGTAGRGGGFAVLHQQGLTPHTIREDLNVREPSAEEVEELDIPPTLAVAELRRWVRTAEGRPVEFAHGVHNALRFSWSYEFEVPE